jgi:hypothetical protein
MFREGEIRVKLALQGGRIRAARIASTRAPLPDRITQARPADEVARTLPLLYSICAQAQAAAAVGALDAARGRCVDTAALRVRGASVRRETVIELLSRLLLDWPRLLGSTPAIAPLARIRQSPAAECLAVCAEVAQQHVYGCAAEDWFEAVRGPGLVRWIEQSVTAPAECLRQLQREAPGLGASDIEPMPAADTDAIAAMLPPFGAGADFSVVPHWHGRPVETGPLARRAADPLLAAWCEQHGNDVTARLVAQLVDLACWLTQDEVQAVAASQAALAPGLGLGAAQTARGLLLHQAQVEDDRVVHYRIVAPTEWNFHPDGPLVRGLVGRAVADAEAARRQAQWLVQALDPCVASEVEVVHA